MPDVVAGPDLSFGIDFDATCPLCGAAFTGRRWSVVDLDVRPDLVVHIEDGSLFRTYCPACIGPGVEQIGPFSLVSRDGAELKFACYFPFGTADIAAEAYTLRDAINGRCAQCGVACVLRPMGSSLFRDLRDLRDHIADVWPDFCETVDPLMVKGPLLALLNAPDTAAREAALLATPDLARPNVEQLLGTLTRQGSEAQRTAAEVARRFISEARRAGIAAARQQDDDFLSPVRRLTQRDPALFETLRRFLSARPGAAPIETTTAGARKLAATLMHVGEPKLASLVWQKCGDLARAEFGARRATGLRAAIDAYQHALDVLPDEAPAERCRLLLNQSGCWDARPDGDRTQNLERALAHAAHAREAAAALPADEQAESAMELGILYMRRLTGDPASNIALAREALTYANQHAATPKVQLLAGYNLALTYIEDGHTTSLKSGVAMLRVYAEQAIDMFNAEQQQNLFQSLGGALARLATTVPDPDAGLLDEAASHVRRALELAQTRASPFEEAFLCGLLARIETDRRVRGRTVDVDEIFALLDRAGETLTPEAAPFEYARNELRRGGIILDLNDEAMGVPLAIEAFKNACRILTVDVEPDLCRRSHSELARLYARRGDIDRAAAAYAVACDASDQVFGATESVTRRAEEVEPNALLYAGYVDALARIEERARAADPIAAAPAAWQVLVAMERGRARLTLDLMGLRPLPRFSGVPESLREREATLLAELSWSLPGASGDRVATGVNPERLRQQRHTRAALEELWNDLERHGEGGRRHVALRRARPLNADALERFVPTVGKQSAIVSFFLLTDRILAVWLAAGSTPVVRSIALTSTELQTQWLESFQHDVLSDAQPKKPEHRWLMLGETLFAPFADFLDRLKLLVVVPHGVLHALPLHALTIAGKPLIERVPVVYGPSVGVLASVVAAARAERSAAASPFVASYAEQPRDRDEFESETRVVARRLHTRARRGLTRAALARAAPRADLMHLVCHAFFDANDALGSGLALADGVMSARDWLSLTLRSDLIVLSACETGRQQLEGGDELTGLARALLQAGSACVLATLWRVYSDAATNWMEHFYGALRGTHADARVLAFRHATLKLRSTDPDPRAWAPFVLIGDVGEGARERNVRPPRTRRRRRAHERPA